MTPWRQYTAAAGIWWWKITNKCRNVLNSYSDISISPLVNASVRHRHFGVRVSPVPLDADESKPYQSGKVKISWMKTIQIKTSEKFRKVQSNVAHPIAILVWYSDSLFSDHTQFPYIQGICSGTTVHLTLPFNTVVLQRHICSICLIHSVHLFGLAANLL